MKPAADFEILVGPAEAGWCDFTVRLNTLSWTCHASYIGDHPLKVLIHSAVDLYNHLFEDPIPVENARWDCLAADEPGGLFLRITPHSGNVKVTLFSYTSEMLHPNPENCPEVPPAAEAVMSYWDYAEGVLFAASRALARQGVTGLRNGWVPNMWHIDGHFEVFPMEHFLYLAALVRDRTPKTDMNLAEERAILADLEKE